MNKQELRKEFKEKRKALPEGEAGRLSELIAGHTIEFLGAHPEWRHIHLFLPIKKNREADTFPILTYLRGNGSQVYTSYIKSGEEEMLTLNITREIDLATNELGIPEPVIKKTVSPEKIQVVLVPLLVVDRMGNRLGYGKGFYDRFFKSLGSDVFKLGLSFFAPVDQIRSEAHDVALDACVFPEGVVVF
jgi:5-formyltetrahydrofolate cyclo-ligase